MKRFRKLVASFVATLMIVSNLQLAGVVQATAKAYPDSQFFDSYDEMIDAWNQHVIDFDIDRFYVSYEVEDVESSKLFFRYIAALYAEFNEENAFTLNTYNVIRDGYHSEMDGVYEEEEDVITVVAEVTIDTSSRGTPAEVNAARAEAASVASAWAGLDQYTQIVSIVNWLCENTAYDYDSINSGDDTIGHSISDCMFRHLCVCEGYAQAFQAMAESLGIESYIVVGEMDGGPHGWNAVMLDGAFYFVDATNADQQWGIDDHFILFGSTYAAEDYVYSTALNISSSDYDRNSPSPVELPTPSPTTTSAPELTETPIPTATSIPVPTNTLAPTETPSEPSNSLAPTTDDILPTSSPTPTTIPDVTPTSTPVPTTALGGNSGTPGISTPTPADSVGTTNTPTTQPSESDVPSATPTPTDAVSTATLDSSPLNPDDSTLTDDSGRVPVKGENNKVNIVTGTIICVSTTLIVGAIIIRRKFRH